jgi:hypothetical protein
MSDIAVIMYTHTDVKDVWPPFFGQTNKYLSDFDRYIFVNNDDSSINDQFRKVFYDDSLGYMKRMISCLKQIDNDYVIYNHEDMFLYSHPNIERLVEYKDKLTDTKPFVRLMRGGNGVGTPDSDFPELIHMNRNIEYIFAIQPSLWLKDKLIEVLENTSGNNLWEFEAQAQTVCKNRNIIGYYVDDGGKKRGKSHWDSKTYPYVATAVTKGKWNTREYPKELSDMASEYNINLSDRGTNG